MTFFADFLWAGKYLKYRREILEAESKDGGLKLHSIALFNTALKLGWLTRYRVQVNGPFFQGNSNLNGYLNMDRTILTEKKL